MAKRIDRRKRKGDRHKPGTQDDYKRAHYDRLTIRLPKGTADSIAKTGHTPSSYLKSLISRETGRALEWIPSRDGVRCACCQALYRYDSYRQPITWRYCPSCGCVTASEDNQAEE